jgi:hypothetical protein
MRRPRPHLAARAGREVVRVVNVARRALGLPVLQRLPDWKPDARDLWGELSCPVARAFPVARPDDNPVAVEDAYPEEGWPWGEGAWKIEFPHPDQARRVAEAWEEPVLCRACVEQLHDMPDPPPCQPDTVKLPATLARYAERFDQRLERAGWRERWW